MNELGNAVTWFVVFAIAFGIYHYVRNKLERSNVGKPTESENREGNL